MSRHKEDELHTSFIGKICPKCGKEFYPVPEHVYKDRRISYCSWTCFIHRDEIPKKVRWKPVMQLTLDGEPIREFQSANQAAEWVGTSVAYIKHAIKHSEQCKGYLWRYVEDV